MMYKTTELKYEPNPALEHALDVLFILHADHEQNCSPAPCASSAARMSIPTPPSPRRAPRFYGPLPGGANEAGHPHADRDRLEANIPASSKR